jgi:hypothetical protein
VPSILPGSSDSFMELLPHLLEILSKPDWSLNELAAETFREPVRHSHSRRHDFSLDHLARLLLFDSDEGKVIF